MVGDNHQLLCDVCRRPASFVVRKDEAEYTICVGDYCATHLPIPAVHTRVAPINTTQTCADGAHENCLGWDGYAPWNRSGKCACACHSRKRARPQRTTAQDRGESLW